MARRRRFGSRDCKSAKHAGEHNAPSANSSKSIDTASRPGRLITKRELCQVVPYTPQHILRLEKEGKFPRRVQVGPNRVAWLESEVEAWVAARVAERDTVVR
jgi:prophage regulatory protein